MSDLSLRAIVAIALLGGASGCIVYNEQCSPLIENPEDVTGYLGGDVSTLKATVRTSDNSFGQLIAESYYFAFESSRAELRPDVAFENSGSIRSEGICTSIDTVPKGPVRRKVLREVLPFDNGVAAVTVTHHQLKKIFEHSVAGLSPTGTASPAGAFLQLYGATVSADCKLPAEALKADGTLDKEGARITAITLLRRDGTTFDIPLVPASDTQTVRVATNSYVVTGGDNYAAFKELDPNANDSLSAGGFNFEIIAQRFKTAYPETKPFPVPPPTRWVLTDCH